MSLKIPLEDDRKEDVLKRGYRCISHYWGFVPPLWDDHPVEGVDWGVKIRREKRKRIIQIFKYHKGYFWMDVFCTNREDVNKPLDIMGNIYKNCMECICLLDTICDVPEFERRICGKMFAKDVKEYSEGKVYEKHDALRICNSRDHNDMLSGKHKTYFYALSW